MHGYIRLHTHQHVLSHAYKAIPLLYANITEPHVLTSTGRVGICYGNFDNYQQSSGEVLVFTGDFAVPYTCYTMDYM